MRERVDRSKVLSSVDIVDVIGRYVPLKKVGSEYSARCPFHEEKSPSFSVNPHDQFYYCFGCGAGGDALTFLIDIEKIPFIDAVKRLNKNALPERPSSFPEPEAMHEIKESNWEPIMPVPDDAYPLMADSKRTCKIFNPKQAGTEKEWTTFRPQMTHPYLNADGNLIGYVLRMEFDDGKITPQITWCVNKDTGECSWAMVNFPIPRPLYGLDQLAAKPKAPVIITEGEKCQESGARMLPNLVSVSWPGGGNGIEKCDWSPLAGRNVFLMRDCDKPGYVTMYGASSENGDLKVKGLAQILEGVGAKGVMAIEPPEDAPKGWDLWDAENVDGWTPIEVVAYIKTHASNPLPPLSMAIEKQQSDDVHEDDSDLLYEAEFKPEDGHAHDHKVDVEPSIGILRNDDPIRALGYDHGIYYYLSKSTRQVVEMTASGHGKYPLIAMASLDFWTNRYPKDMDSGTVQWDMAVNAMMRACEDSGVFDHERLRGRGAWWDDGKAVLHLGDHLVVDGGRVELNDKQGWFIYEAASPMRVDIANPLSASESRQFLEICKRMQWEKPIDAYLLAGWIFLAPICGALDWRPHIWITGGAGSGKSWAMHNIVGRLTGRFSVNALSSTTEAGIRQKLGHDARPVLFDEAEGEDIQAQQRIQNVMQLIRQASSESGGEILKGSAGGKAQSFRIRSMFAFASIGVSVHQYADKTRVSVLQMRPDLSKSPEYRERQFHDLERMTYEILTDQYIERMHARAVRMIGTIRQNSRTFAQAGARLIGQQRLGDQIGALLAGAYAMHSNNVITLDEAREWIGNQDWSEEFMMAEQRDELSCLQRILEHVIRVTTNVGMTVERSIGEVVRVASNGNPASTSERIDENEAYHTLLRCGIKAERGTGCVTISNTHTFLAKILRDSPWPTNWSRILSRIPGAISSKPVHFTGGSARGVSIPLDQIFQPQNGDKTS